LVAAARGRQGRSRKLVHCLVCKSYSQLEHQQAWLRRLAGSQAGQSEQADNENSHVGAAGGQDQLDGSLLLSTAPIKARCGLPRCCSGKRLLGEQGPGPDPAVQDERGAHYSQRARPCSGCCMGCANHAQQRRWRRRRRAMACESMLACDQASEAWGPLPSGRSFGLNAFSLHGRPLVSL